MGLLFFRLQGSVANSSQKSQPKRQATRGWFYFHLILIFQSCQFPEIVARNTQPLLTPPAKLSESGIWRDSVKAHFVCWPARQKSGI
jgi:hypothetical protein